MILLSGTASEIEGLVNLTAILRQQFLPAEQRSADHLADWSTWRFTLSDRKRDFLVGPVLQEVVDSGMTVLSRMPEAIASAYIQIQDELACFDLGQAKEKIEDSIFDGVFIGNFGTGRQPKEWWLAKRQISSVRGVSDALRATGVVSDGSKIQDLLAFERDSLLALGPEFNESFGSLLEALLDRDDLSFSDQDRAQIAKKGRPFIAEGLVKKYTGRLRSRDSGPVLSAAGSVSVSGSVSGVFAVCVRAPKVGISPAVPQDSRETVNDHDLSELKEAMELYALAHREGAVEVASLCTKEGISSYSPPSVKKLFARLSRAAHDRAEGFMTEPASPRQLACFQDKLYEDMALIEAATVEARRFG